VSAAIRMARRSMPTIVAPPSQGPVQIGAPGIQIP
jgi:hypothetical protein